MKKVRRLLELLPTMLIALMSGMAVSVALGWKLQGQPHWFIYALPLAALSVQRALRPGSSRARKKAFPSPVLRLLPSIFFTGIFCVTAWHLYTAGHRKPDFSPDPKFFDPFIGEYYVNHSSVFRVRRAGNRYLIKSVRQPEWELFPEALNRFYLKELDSQVTFSGDPSGRMAQMVIHQGEMENRLPKAGPGPRILPPAAYRRAEPGVKTALVRPFVQFDRPANLSNTWADTAANGTLTAKSNGFELQIQYDTGKGWGCGVSMPSNAGPFVGPDLVDLRGCDSLRFKAVLPEGARFMVNLSEAGVGKPGLNSYGGFANADGESYTFPLLYGTGQWETYEINLACLDKRTGWGNQMGNNVLDLQASNLMDFFIPGRQGRGQMSVKDVEFIGNQDLLKGAL